MAIPDIKRVAMPRRQIVGHRGQILGQATFGGGASDSNYTRHEARIGFYTPNVWVSDIQFKFAGWLNSNGEQLNNAAVTVDAGIEWGGAFKRMKFNGATSVSVTAGNDFFCDPIHIAIPPNTLIWVRVDLVIASGAFFPQGYFVSIPGDGFFNSTAASSQINGVGPMSVQSGGEIAAGGWGPIAMTGLTKTRIPAFGGLGDSNMWGFGDTPDTNGNLGWFTRGCWNAGGGALPQYRGLRSGDTLALNSPYNSDLKKGSLQDCTEIWLAVGQNDLAAGTGPGASLGAMQTALSAFWADGSTRGNVNQVLYTTRTTGAWTLLDQSDQTITSPFGVGALCDQVNAWIITRATAGEIANYFDPRPFFQTANNKIVANGTPNYATPEGTHFGPVMSALIGAGFQAQFAVPALSL